MTKETAPTKNRNRSKQRITPRALLEAKRLSEPKIHPDGRHVVFVVTEADFDESRWVSHLWLTEWPAPEEGMPEGTEASESRMVTDGTEDTDKATPPRDASFVTERQEEGPESVSSVIQTEEKNEHARQLTFSYDGETRPRWSPDGRYLAFLSARPDESEPPEEDEEDEEDEPKQQLWVLPAEAGEARKITSAKEGVLDYAWTPDGSALIYLAPEPRPRPIESVRKEERSRRKLDPVVEQEDRLRRQFWRVDVEERKPKLLYTGDYGIDDFALSPDGERIGFVTNYTGEWNDYHKVDLWILNLADGKAFQLLERRGGKYRLRWSPDGTQIAFLSWLDPQLSYSRESLFVADVPAIGQEAGFPTAGSCRLATGACGGKSGLLPDRRHVRHEQALAGVGELRIEPGEKGDLRSVRRPAQPVLAAAPLQQLERLPVRQVQDPQIDFMIVVPFPGVVGDEADPLAIRRERKVVDAVITCIEQLRFALLDVHPPELAAEAVFLFHDRVQLAPAALLLADALDGTWPRLRGQVDQGRAVRRPRIVEHALFGAGDLARLARLSRQDPELLLRLVLFVLLILFRRLALIRAGGEEGEIAAVRRPSGARLAVVREGELARVLVFFLCLNHG